MRKQYRVLDITDTGHRPEGENDVKWYDHYNRLTTTWDDQCQRRYERARAFVEMGYSIMPIKPGLKEPDASRGHSIHSRIGTVEKVDELFGRGKPFRNCNYAIVTGVGDCTVVDVDVKSNQLGLNTIRRLEAEHGELPQGPLVYTPSGGQHHFFAYDPDLVTDCRTLRDQGIDLLSSKKPNLAYGYVVGPESVLFETRRQRNGVYKEDMVRTIVSTLDLAEVRLPNWFVELFPAHREESADVLPFPDRPDFLASKQNRGNEAVMEEDLLREWKPDEVTQLLGFIPCDELSQEEWVRVGWALHAWNQEHGLELWTTWSKADPERFHAGECEKRWNGFKDKVNGITLGTVIFMAQEHGYIVRKDREQTVANNTIKGLTRDGNGNIHKTAQNLETILKSEWFRDHYELAFDEFHQFKTIDTKDKEGNTNRARYTDEDTTRFRVFLTTFFGEFDKQKTIDVVNLTARATIKNEWREWLEALPTWDEYDHIGELVNHVSGDKCPSAYHTFWKKTLVAAIARAYQPGCQVRIFPVLIGGQNIGKSRLWHLLPPNRWHNESCDFHKLTKDNGARELIRTSRGVVFTENAELKGITKHIWREFKHFTGGTKIEGAEKYKTESEEFKRIGVPVGTSNDSEFLSDDTGNTRVLPIVCRQMKGGETFDFDYIVENRNNIWSQALALYHMGKTWWLETEQQHQQLYELSNEHEATWGPSLTIKEWVENDNPATISGMVLMTYIQDQLRMKTGQVATVKDVDRAFRLLGWTKDVVETPQGNGKTKMKTWKFQIRADDLPHGAEKIRLWNKDHAEGDTVRCPAMWVSPTVMERIRKTAGGESVTPGGESLTPSDLARGLSKTWGELHCDKTKS